MINIAFWVLITTCVLWIVWDLIPDSPKEYMKYRWQLKRDKKKGRKGKYSFNWRIGGNR